MSEEKKIPAMPEAIIWGTSVDMPESVHQRKTYRMKITDADKEILFDLQVHADGTIIAVPYVASDYDYTDMDDDPDVIEDRYQRLLDKGYTEEDARRMSNY